MIPRILHQIWLGPSPMPYELARFCETWKSLHPGWTLRLWTERDFNPNALVNRRVYRDAELIAPGSEWQLRADLLRYEILREHGGVYVDADMECLRAIDELLVDVACFLAWEAEPVWINNAIMGATPGHELLDTLVAGLERHVAKNTNPRRVRPNVLTGPQYLTPIVREHAARVPVKIFPQATFYPYLWSELARSRESFPDSYAVHHWNNARKRQGVALP